MIRSYKY